MRCVMILFKNGACHLPAMNKAIIQELIVYSNVINSFEKQPEINSTDVRSSSSDLWFLQLTLGQQDRRPSDSRQYEKPY